MFYLIFNNKNSYTDFNLRITKRPVIPAPVKNINKIEITGHDGDLYEDLGGYADIKIAVNFNFIDKDNIKNSWRKIKSWLNNAQDNKLIFSDDIEFYYKVKNITLSELTITKRILGTFTATFICEAYCYDISGLNSIQLSNNSILYNYLDTSKPLIKAYGGGVATITVNGQSFVIDVGEYVYIDSVLELTYKDKNTAGNLQVGEYPVLINGENLISWDSNITKLEIQPNWRCL